MSESPTASPTFEPASRPVVTAIFCLTLFGIVGILLMYFVVGYYSYTANLKTKVIKAEAKIAEARAGYSDGDINSGMFPMRYTPGNTFDEH